MRVVLHMGTAGNLPVKKKKWDCETLNTTIPHLTSLKPSGTEKRMSQWGPTPRRRDRPAESARSAAMSRLAPPPPPPPPPPPRAQCTTLAASDYAVYLTQQRCQLTRSQCRRD